MTRTTRAARAVALAFAITLAVLTVAPAQRAMAYPANTWWYQYLKLPDVWKIEKGSGVVVGLIDSGVAASLGDLKGQVLPGTALAGATGDGRTDTADPNFPGVGHGTSMATLIAGTGKGAGIIGVAPEAKIQPVALGNNFDLRTNDVIAQAIRWQVDHGADIVNVSLGGYQTCPDVEQDAVRYAVDHNVLVVASAGDSGPSAIAAPADCIGAIGVGGYSANNVDGSEFGIYADGGAGPELDFVGPGVHTAAERLDGTFGVTGSGSSQAAAITSGIFALLRAHFPDESVSRLVQRALYNTHNGLGKQNLGKRIDDRFGYGAILPYFALTVSVPTSRPNPIFAEFKQYERAHPTSTPSSSSTPVAVTPGPSTSAPAAANDDSGSSSGSPAVIVVGAVVVVGLVVFGVVLTRRRRAG